MWHWVWSLIHPSSMPSILPNLESKVIKISWKKNENNALKPLLCWDLQNCHNHVFCMWCISKSGAKIPTCFIIVIYVSTELQPPVSYFSFSILCNFSNLLTSIYKFFHCLVLWMSKLVVHGVVAIAWWYFSAGYQSVDVLDCGTSISFSSHLSLHFGSHLDIFASLMDILVSSWETWLKVYLHWTVTKQWARLTADVGWHSLTVSLLITRWHFECR